MSASTTIQSPDGRYAIEQQDDYGEIGMGSPAYRESYFHSGGLGHAVRDFDEEPNDVSKAQSRIGALPNGSYFVYQATPGKHK